MPAELLQSSVYTIDERVPTDGLVATRTFHSPLGEFLAEGPGMTAVRAAEIQALDVLTKTESSEIFQKALAASMKRTGQSLKKVVTNPVETLQGVPAGVGRFFDRVTRDVKTGMRRSRTRRAPRAANRDRVRARRSRRARRWPARA